MLSSHLLGPLFLEYEAVQRQMERELRAKEAEVQRQAEDVKALARENEDLAQRLEVQQREYLKVVEETRDHADVHVGKEGSEEVRDLKERVHLLSEENQALFEHVTLLRAHFDGFNKTCGETLEEAKAKSQAFDLLHG